MTDDDWIKLDVLTDDTNTASCGLTPLVPGLTITVSLRIVMPNKRPKAAGPPLAILHAPPVQQEQIIELPPMTTSQSLFFHCVCVHNSEEITVLSPVFVWPKGRRSSADAHATASLVGVPVLYVANMHGDDDVAIDVFYADPVTLQTAMHHAALRGDVERASVLLSKGGAVDARDRQGFTPLHYALALGRFDVAKLFLEMPAGANPNAQTMMAWDTPAHLTVRNQESPLLLGVLSLLRDRGAVWTMANRGGDSPLHDAAVSGGVQTISWLLDPERGVPLNPKNRFGDTPLHKAARAGHTAVVHMLVNAGADVTVVGNGGTPLEVARAGHHTQIVQLLEERLPVKGHVRAPYELDEKASASSAKAGDDISMRIDLTALSPLRNALRTPRRAALTARCGNNGSPTLDATGRNRALTIDISSVEEAGSNELYSVVRSSVDEGWRIKRSSLVESAQPETSEASLSSDTSDDTLGDDKATALSEPQSSKPSKSDVGVVKPKNRKRRVRRHRSSSNGLDVENGGVCERCGELANSRVAVTLPTLTERSVKTCRPCRDVLVSKKVTGAMMALGDGQETPVFVQAAHAAFDMNTLEEADIDVGTVIQLTLQWDEWLFRDNFVRADGHLLKHKNIVGVTHTSSPIAITFSSEVDRTGTFLAIVRTPETDTMFRLPLSAVNNRRVPTSRQLLFGLGAHLHRMFANANAGADVPKVFRRWKDYQWFKVRNPTLTIGFLEFEHRVSYTNYKFGVLLVDGSPCVLDVNETTEAFDEFLDMLGERIALRGWSGYAGDLDVSSMCETGERSVFAEFDECQLMYHVSPMLPYEPSLTTRRTYLGNDLVLLLFVERGHVDIQGFGTMFPHAHVLLLVEPHVMHSGSTGYIVSTFLRMGVPDFGPMVPRNFVFGGDDFFRTFLRTKLINAERAALQGPHLPRFMQRSRAGMLTRMVDRFRSESEEFTILEQDDNTLKSKLRALRKH